MIIENKLDWRDFYSQEALRLDGHVNISIIEIVKFIACIIKQYAFKRRFPPFRTQNYI